MFTLLQRDFHMCQSQSGSAFLESLQYCSRAYRILYFFALLRWSRCKASFTLYSPEIGNDAILTIKHFTAM